MEEGWRWVWCLRGREPFVELGSRGHGGPGNGAFRSRPIGVGVPASTPPASASPTGDPAEVLLRPRRRVTVPTGTGRWSVEVGVGPLYRPVSGGLGGTGSPVSCPSTSLTPPVCLVSLTFRSGDRYHPRAGHTGLTGVSGPATARESRRRVGPGTPVRPPSPPTTPYSGWTSGGRWVVGLHGYIPVQPTPRERPAVPSPRFGVLTTCVAPVRTHQLCGFPGRTGVQGGSVPPSVATRA